MTFVRLALAAAVVLLTQHQPLAAGNDTGPTTLPDGRTDGLVPKGSTSGTPCSPVKECYVKPYAEVAIAFASALVDGDFTRAKALLSPELRMRYTTNALRAKFYRMISYSDGEPQSIYYDEEFQGEDWPDKREGDVGWVYVGIDGDGFVEAVSVVVAKIDGQLFIREIEWGRP